MWPRFLRLGLLWDGPDSVTRTSLIIRLLNLFRSLPVSSKLPMVYKIQRRQQAILTEWFGLDFLILPWPPNDSDWGRQMLVLKDPHFTRIHMVEITLYSDLPREIVLNPYGELITKWKGTHYCGILQLKSFKANLADLQANAWRSAKFALKL